MLLVWTLVAKYHCIRDERAYNADRGGQAAAQPKILRGRETCAVNLVVTFSPGCYFSGDIPTPTSHCIS